MGKIKFINARDNAVYKVFVDDKYIGNIENKEATFDIENGTHTFRLEKEGIIVSETQGVPMFGAIGVLIGAIVNKINDKDINKKITINDSLIVIEFKLLKNNKVKLIAK